MMNPTTREKEQAATMASPQAARERRYIKQYLLSKGYAREDLDQLPQEQRRELLIEASIYASSKLAEEEQRSRLVQEMHGKSKCSSQS
jgi:hypothetical protein